MRIRLVVKDGIIPQNNAGCVTRFVLLMLKLKREMQPRLTTTPTEGKLDKSLEYGLDSPPTTKPCEQILCCVEGTRVYEECLKAKEAGARALEQSDTQSNVKYPY